MSEVVKAALALAAHSQVAPAVAEAREACTALRWHQALRRRIPEAAAESRVRGAWASGELEGARLSTDIVRDLMRGAVGWHEPPDPVERVMKGVIAATAETESLGPVLDRAPMQALARLHTLAAADLLDVDQLGRPRRTEEDARELLEVSPAPPADEARVRLLGVAELLGAADRVPAPVLAALVHAEVMHARPFVRANGVVARALERLVVHAKGLDPTGVSVPEVGHGGPSYLGSLTAYATAGHQGVVLWVKHCCSAYVAGATEGARIADAVLAGRLT